MSTPLDKLTKILQLEAEKHEDRAVFGGLAQYADVWHTEASEHFGAYAQRWILEIADRMRSYSRLGIDKRDDALASILELTSQVPTGRDGLEASVTVLHGVGPRQAQRLALLGVQTIRDLLYLFPRRYDDLSHLKPINRLEYGEETTVIARVKQAHAYQTRSGRPIFKAILSDGSGTIEATWFNQRYLGETIKPGKQIVVSGKVDEFLGRLCFKSPIWELFDEQLLHTARIVPIYPLTEGLGARWMRRLMQRTVEYWSLRTPDHLPIPVREEYDLLDLEHALTQIHFPDTQNSLARAQRRLIFDELFLMQLGLQQQRNRWQSVTGKALSIDESTMENLLAGLPFELTGAQKRVLNQVADDLRTDRPMHRLLQGDVGSGKTIVAALSMAIAVASGVQVALMAPTEILAEQHYRTLTRFFEKVPGSPEVRLLTGSVQGAEREEILTGLADGTAGIAIGTHALIQETVTFQELGLVIIDEQHRFGVRQRSALRQKGYHPHTLTMTATPIPRSLALTVWGHLDVSVIDEMPPRRQPVITQIMLPSERERAYAFVRRQIAQSHQAFIICPLVEESEKIEAKAAVEEYQRLQSQIFSDLRLGLLHGKMKNNEKDEVMSQFVQGELDILVATSVVEVGIDVPNATVMMIEGADRFGLAQLHQFRGRVGRGEGKSFCLLVSSSSAERATERLGAVAATNDGFVLAEKDLELRGPGEFLGTRQAGFPELKLAKVTDLPMI